MPHRSSLSARVAVALVCILSAAATACSETARTPVSAPTLARGTPTEALQLDNPLILQRADAQILHHSDGAYVFAATVPEYDRIELRRADTLAGLRDAPGVVVWRRHSSGVMAAHIWAPEIHFIDGRWYIYFAAGSSTDVWAIRIVEPSPETLARPSLILGRVPQRSPRTRPSRRGKPCDDPLRCSRACWP